MARKKIGLQVKGFEEYMAKLDEVGGSAAMKRGVESALKESKAYVNPLITSAMSPSNLPAQGDYSQGGTLESLDRDMTVHWEGMTAHVKVGFDFKQSGLKSIVLMYGTPKMSPVNGLYAAIYGAKTQRELATIQEEALQKVIKRIMEG